MDLLVQAIFEAIEQNEKEAHKVYQKLAKKMQDPLARKTLLALADQELSHEHFFSESDAKELMKIPESELQKISLSLKSHSSDSISETKGLLQFAITEERKAEESYRLLAKHLPESEAKKKIIEIASHEKHHAEVLQKILGVI